MRRDERPDWENYTLEELQEALEGLNRKRYPERAVAIEDLLRARREAPPAPTGPLRAEPALPDWANYTLTELEQALAGLDRERYPEHERIIQECLQKRRASGEDNTDEA